jgi:hypothetical protein
MSTPDGRAPFGPLAEAMDTLAQNKSFKIIALIAAGQISNLACN